jgi:hypothetical protein
MAAVPTLTVLHPILMALHLYAELEGTEVGTLNLLSLIPFYCLFKETHLKLYITFMAILI